MIDFNLMLTLIVSVPFIVLVVALIAALLFQRARDKNSNTLNWQRVNSKRVTYPPLKVVMDMVDYFDYVRSKRSNPLVTEPNNTVHDAGIRFLKKINNRLVPTSARGDVGVTSQCDNISDGNVDNDNDVDEHPPFDNLPYVGDYPRIAYTLVDAGKTVWDGDNGSADGIGEGNGTGIFKRFILKYRGGNVMGGGSASGENTDNLLYEINDYYDISNEVISLSVVPADGIGNNTILSAEDGDYNKTVTMTTASVAVLCHEAGHFFQARDGNTRFVVEDVLGRISRLVGAVALPAALVLLMLGFAPLIIVTPVLLFLLLIIMKGVLVCTYEKQASNMAREFLKSSVGYPWRRANGIAWVLNCGYRTYVYRLAQHIALFVAVCCFAQCLDMITATL